MKIKIFKCDKICNECLRNIEKEINTFSEKHKIINVMVNTVSNNFGAVIIYSLLYEEQ